MKISIALTLFILALGLPLGWRDRHQLTSARERHAQLVAEAARATNISRDPASRRKVERSTKREHENKEQVAMRMAADFIAAAKNGNRNETEQVEQSELLAAAASLNADQLQILFTEILASKGLTDEARQELLFSLAVVASDRPQAALALITKIPDVLKIAGLDKVLVCSSLTKWVKDDPLAAIAWVRQNRDVFSKSMDEESRMMLIASAAENHLDLALQMVDQLGLDSMDQRSALSMITLTPKTAEDLTASLATINAHLAALPAGEKRDQMSKELITGIMNNAARGGFDSGSQWIDHAGFTPEQLMSMFKRNLVWVTQVHETGKWVEWMGKTNTGEDKNTWMEEMVRRWAQEDYLAAGKWLPSIPDGPTKNLSISSFAKTVSLHDPASAEQWAMTLPPGENRADTLERIYQNWPEGGEAAKQAFAKKHGLR